MTAQEGVPAGRVVAVIAHLKDGRTQWRSGFLVTHDRVVTALHCTVDKESKTRQAALSLEVIRESDGAPANVTSWASSRDLDITGLGLDDPPPWARPWDRIQFARVPRDVSAQLVDCTAVGYPLFQRDPTDRQRNAAELHGTIRQMDDAASGFLRMRDPALRDVLVPPSVTGPDRELGRRGVGCPGRRCSTGARRSGLSWSTNPASAGPRSRSCPSTTSPRPQTRTHWLSPGRSDYPPRRPCRG